MIWVSLLVTKLENYLNYVRDQITRLLANLDKSGIVFVMDLGKSLYFIRIHVFIYNVYIMYILGGENISVI